MSIAASNTVAPTATETEHRRLERALRFQAREFLHEHSALSRIRRCSFRPIDRTAGVGVAVGDGIGHFTGVQLCGSIHACPVCAPKIRETRASEVNRAAVAHLEAGGGLAFVTLTLPHGHGDDLAALLDSVADGWRRIWQGRSGQARRATWGNPGYIRALDFTHGANGWHPHLHVLLFLPEPLDDDQLDLLERDLYVPWSQWSVERGHGLPSRRHGVRVDAVRTRPELGGYIAKIDDGWHAGRELSRSDLKKAASGSRTPWQILRSAAENGDVDDLSLWKVYELATKGRRAITWSRGLKARYAIEEQTDEEIAEAEVGGDLVALIPTDVWGKLRRRRGLTVRVLTAAEVGGFWAVRDLLVHELGWALASAVKPPPEDEETPT